MVVIRHCECGEKLGVFDGLRCMRCHCKQKNKDYERLSKWLNTHGMK
jgi:hypothetical protein